MFMDLYFYRSVDSSVWINLPFSGFSATNLMRLEMYDVFLAATSVSSSETPWHRVSILSSKSITSCPRLLWTSSSVCSSPSDCDELLRVQTSALPRSFAVSAWSSSVHTTHAGRFPKNMKQTSPIPVVLNDVRWLKIGFERNTRDLSSLRCDFLVKNFHFFIRIRSLHLLDQRIGWHGDGCILSHQQSLMLWKLQIEPTHGVVRVPTSHFVIR